ncbi:hypothetical protein F4861DRAFT_81587 [Xylaria intraflava]|nr:hypothetical protein F4861DRAFT_81587 [Xylaria intraflava]
MANVENSMPSIDSLRPKTRQRIYKDLPALAVPDINDDAHERKRVLNVLAQRRYRERKRQVKRRHGAQSTTSTPELPSQDKEPSALTNENAAICEDPIPENRSPLETYLSPPSTHDFPLTDLEMDSGIVSQIGWPAESSEAAVTTSLLLGMEEPHCPDTTGSSVPNPQLEISAIGVETASPGFLDTMDPIALLGSSSSSPSSSNNSESTVLSFPDSYYLPVNELTLLRGLMRIAMRLRCNTTSIWQLTANSPFNDGTHTPQTAQELPSVWRPTLSQSSIPHHPVIDLLPWPNVRDRVIELLGLPDEARPHVAAGPLLIAQLAYDLEDGAEGVRIWGDDPCEPSSWEIGQVLFERWWFIFDRQIIDQSNYWRRLRGAATLTIKG